MIGFVLLWVHFYSLDKNACALFVIYCTHITHMYVQNCLAALSRAFFGAAWCCAFFIIRRIGMRKEVKIIKVIIVTTILLISILIVLAIIFSFSNTNDHIDYTEETSIERQTDDRNNSIEETTNEEIVSETTVHISEVPYGYIGIYTVDDLNYIKSSPQYNYILMNNLDFNDYSDEWGEYDLNGIFEGNNYTISNYNGKHPFLRNVGAIFNLTLDNATVDGLTYSLSGDTITFYSSLLCRKIVGVSGIEQNMDNCTVNGTINVQWNGESQYFELKYMYENQGVFIGGLCSVTDMNISNCLFNGTIDINYTNTDRESEFSVGGITGSMSNPSSISFCNAFGNITLYANNDYCKFNAGGISGKFTTDSTIQSSGNSMNISGNTRSSAYGGIVGADTLHGGGYITKSFNKGNITSTSEWDHEAAYTTTSLGGIVGEGTCTIENCYNSASIVGGEVAGGIIGRSAYSNISKVYNVGNIECNKYKEWNLDTSETFHKGAIIGIADNKNYGSLNYCYYTNEDIYSVYDNPQFPFVKYLSENDAKNQNCYQGFNFDNEWESGDNNYPYPKLTNVNGQ